MRRPSKPPSSSSRAPPLSRSLKHTKLGSKNGTLFDFQFFSTVIPGRVVSRNSFRRSAWSTDRSRVGERISKWYGFPIFDISGSQAPPWSNSSSGSVLYYIGLLYSSSWVGFIDQNVELLHSCKWDRYWRPIKADESISRAQHHRSRTRTPVCVLIGGG
jgi:hypothetical protein